MARKGDLPAFETLVNRHERRLYGFARRLTSSAEDAQDLTQETLITALKKISTLRDGGAFGQWLAVIVARAAMKTIHERRDRRTISGDAESISDDGESIPHPLFIADWRAAPDELAQYADTRRHLDEAIATLSPGLRAVFLLRDVEGLSARETAATLGITEGAVKVRLLRARLALRERLTSVFGDPNRRAIPHAHDGEGQE